MLFYTFFNHLESLPEVFRAATVIAQLCISHGEPLFQVQYSENPWLAVSGTASGIMTPIPVFLEAASIINN
jgi:hypothetical protein